MIRLAEEEFYASALDNEAKILGIPSNSPVLHLVRKPIMIRIELSSLRLVLLERTSFVTRLPINGDIRINTLRKSRLFVVNLP